MALLRRSAPESVAWHPNFRDESSLPDTSVVRVGFFLNIVAITLLVASALVLGYTELQTGTVQSELEAAKEKLDRVEPRLAEVTREAARFEAAARRLEEVDRFAAAAVSPTEVFLAMARDLPPAVVLTSIRWTPALVTVSGQASGSVTEASTVVNAYQQQLAKADLIRDKLGQVVLAQVVPLQSQSEEGVVEDGVRFEITLRPKS